MHSKKQDCRAYVRGIAASVLEHESVQSMAAFCQHGCVSTLDHCLNVAAASLALSRALHLDVHEEHLVEGAILHDFFLYDWHEKQPDAPFHATRHPLYAARNAREIMHVGSEVEHIIVTHMWPLPPNRIPLSKEAWIVCAADKYCSLKETLFNRRSFSL